MHHRRRGARNTLDWLIETPLHPLMRAQRNRGCTSLIINQRHVRIFERIADRRADQPRLLTSRGKAAARALMDDEQLWWTLGEGPQACAWSLPEGRTLLDASVCVSFISFKRILNFFKAPSLDFLLTRNLSNLSDVHDKLYIRHSLSLFQRSHLVFRPLVDIYINTDSIFKLNYLSSEKSTVLN